MSYLERLNAFDQARSATQEHIENIKKSLSNPEYEENPVKAGLETTGSVLGTAEGLLKLKRELGERGTLRNTAKEEKKALKEKMNAIIPQAQSALGPPYMGLESHTNCRM